MSDAQSFGQWLKARRKALDLTQEALSERVGCAVDTIRRFEAGRLRPSREVAARMADQLELGEDEAVRFVHAARQVTRTTPAAPVRPPASPVRILPVPLTPLIGRAAEVAAICALLQQPHRRLVTLTGAGGIGKTRVSLAVGATLLAAFADGVVVVELAALRDPALVLRAIARTLEVPDTGAPSLAMALEAFLRSKQLLLILDNIEHLVTAAPRIVDLLAAAPGVRVLATSRTLLQVSGEHVVALTPLDVPDQACTSLAQVAQYAAAGLFLERVRAVRPSLALRDVDAPTVAEICRRLDGLPLALELAAARSTVLTPSALLQRLASPLALLTGGGRDLPARQQTLRATIAWSYALLPEATQHLFTRLAVCGGDWTLEAAAAIGAVDADPMAVLEQVQTLVNHSLLVARSGAEPRFLYLETVREYAWEQLCAGGHDAATRQRHLAYYLGLAETGAAELRGAQQHRYLDLLEQEQHHLRAALGWALEQDDANAALRLSTALWQFWDMRGDAREGEQWLARALALDPQAPIQLRAAALHGAGWLAYHRHDDERAAALHADALALRRRLNDHQGIADSLRSLAGAMSDRQQAERLTEECVAIYRQLGDQPGLARALLNLGVFAHTRSDNARASARYDEALAQFGALGDTWGRAMTLHHMAWARYEQGHVERADALAREGLDLWRTLRDPQRLAEMLVVAGYLALTRGDVERADACYAELQAMADAHGAELAEYTTTPYHGDLALARGDEAAAQACYAASLDIARRQHNVRAMGEILRRMGALAHTRGDVERAETLYRESLAHAQAAEDQLGQTMVLFEVALLRMAQGQLLRGVQLYLGAQRALAELGAGLGFERARYETHAAAARARLSEQGVAVTSADEHGMDFEQAVTVALAS